MDRNAQCTAIENFCKPLNVTCCLVSCKHHLLTIVSAYRSPSILSIDCLLEIRDMFFVMSYVIVVGDFNFDLFTTSIVLSGNTLTYYKIFNLFSMFLILLPAFLPP